MVAYQTKIMMEELSLNENQKEEVRAMMRKKFQKTGKFWDNLLRGSLIP